MALFDLPLEALWEYRPQLSEPEDLMPFWEGTLSQAREASSPLLALERVDNGLTLIDTWDVTFAGHDGSPVRAWYQRPAGAQADLPVVVEYLGYGGGRGEPLERLAFSTAGYGHLVMDTRGQGSTWGAGGHTADPAGSGPAASGVMTRGVASPHTSYLTRLFTDAVRAVDTARELPGADGRIALTGNSQGGGLALGTAGLVPDVDALAANVPFLTHMRRAVQITDADPYQEIVRYLAVHRDLEEIGRAHVSTPVTFRARLPPPASPSCPYTTLFRSGRPHRADRQQPGRRPRARHRGPGARRRRPGRQRPVPHAHAPRGPDHRRRSVPGDRALPGGAPGPRGADLHDPGVRRRAAPGSSRDRARDVRQGREGLLLDGVRGVQPLRQRHRRGPRSGDGRLPLQQPRGRRPCPAAPSARLAARSPVSDAADDLAWLGAHAAVRLPREVHLHACAPLAATVGAEIARLRELATGADGTLTLHDPVSARESGAGSEVLEQLADAGEESFALRADGEDLTLIAGGDRGLLHGFYAVVLGLGETTADGWSLRSPAQPIRMLDHWDNMTVHPVMGQIERGYAGGSLFYEHGELREDLSRVEHYARLLAAVGINRVSLNNVNVHAHEATLLTTRLDQVARLAETFRAQGISVLLSVSFASPRLLGGLETSDPLDIEVQDWWRRTADAVYAAIPDFGGFVVKADSEGQPGPFAYGRDHADGANLLARALAPHGGEVFWRAFVYDHHQDWRDRRTDRARAAHDHFAPLDGHFDDNVIVQIKHGPMDFQTREPVSPVIGAMPRTRLAVELQVTQEYTGQQKHLCYLAPWWSENLRFPFGDPEAGAPTLAQLVAGTEELPGGLVAVSNVGADEFWTGHPLAQANLFALGRLAWDPQLTPDRILQEWIEATFGT